MKWTFIFPCLLHLIFTFLLFNPAILIYEYISLYSIAYISFTSIFTFNIFSFSLYKLRDSQNDCLWQSTCYMCYKDRFRIFL